MVNSSGFSGFADELLWIPNFFVERFSSGSCSGVEGQGRCAFATHDLAARELLLEELNAEAVLAVVAVAAFFVIVTGLPSIIFHAF